MNKNETTGKKVGRIIGRVMATIEIGRAHV